MSLGWFKLVNFWTEQILELSASGWTLNCWVTRNMKSFIRNRWPTNIFILLFLPVSIRKSQYLLAPSRGTKISGYPKDLNYYFYFTLATLCNGGCCNNNNLEEGARFDKRARSWVVAHPHIFILLFLPVSIRKSQYLLAPSRGTKISGYPKDLNYYFYFTLATLCNGGCCNNNNLEEGARFDKRARSWVVAHPRKLKSSVPTGTRVPFGQDL